MYSPHIVLAAMQDGSHTQVGAAATREGAHALWTALDGDLIGPHGRGSRYHTIDGQAVRFYRVRQVEPARLVSHGTHILAVDNITDEFGAVPFVNLTKLGKRVSL
jgi:hypothetical protein